MKILYVRNQMMVQSAGHQMEDRAHALSTSALAQMSDAWPHLYKDSPYEQNAPRVPGEGLLIGLRLAEQPCQTTPCEDILSSLDCLDLTSALGALAVNAAILEANSPDGARQALDSLKAAADKFPARFCGTTYAVFSSLLCPEYIQMVQAIYLTSVGWEWDCKKHTGPARGTVILARFASGLQYRLGTSEFVNMDLEGLLNIAASMGSGMPFPEMTINKDVIAAGLRMAEGMLERVRTYVTTVMRREGYPQEIEDYFTALLEDYADNGGESDQPDRKQYNDFARLVSYLRALVMVQNIYGGRLWSQSDDLEKLWLTLYDVVEDKEPPHA